MSWVHWEILVGGSVRERYGVRVGSGERLWLTCCFGELWKLGCENGDWEEKFVA